MKTIFPALLTIILCFACREDRSHLFTRLDPDATGIRFRNMLEENEEANVLNYTYFYNGGGVAVGDINSDGLPDILFTGNMVPNRLYLNKGDFKFEDVTEQTGIAAAQGWCTGATITDVNGDGLPDIYICRSADVIPARRKNLLYINGGDLAFTEQAAAYGLADEGYSTQASFFDYDRDGDLDMFLVNHSLQQYANEGLENPALRTQQQPLFASKLFRNDNNKFTDVSREAGIISNVLSFGLAAAITDINNDGWPDIYVSNDFNEPDYLFVNNGNGSFSEQLSEAMDEISLFSMGSDAADFNNDGLTDIVTLDMLQRDNYGQKMHNGAENFDKFSMLYKNGFYYQSSRNMLHRNNGNGSFSEIGRIAGIAATDWSWSALFCDFDNDGWKDLAVTNGYVKDYTNMDFIKYSMDRTIKERAGEKKEPATAFISRMPSIVMQNQLYRNNHDNTFTVSNDEWGLREENVSAGAAYADLDNDGNADLVINNTNGYAGVYRNNGAGNNYLRLSLKGPSGNTSGIGSQVKVFLKDEILLQEQYPVRGFQSSVDHRLLFGIGKAGMADSIVIRWPDGRSETIKNAEANTELVADWTPADGPVDIADINNGSVPANVQSSPASLSAGVRPSPVLQPANIHPSPDPLSRGTQPLPPAPAFQPYFTADELFRFAHRENEHNDFTIQPLMPNYLSRQGPCLARADINNDGRDDIFIGGASGQASAIMIQNKNDLFERMLQPAIAADSLSEDVDAVFFDANNDGHQDLYVASGGYELNAQEPALQDRLYINNGKGIYEKKTGALPLMNMSTGCVRPYDIDGDGNTDLFIGGRVIPGKYPSTPPGYILINDGKGNFTDQTAALAPALKNAGMVTDAVWADVNGDKHADLIVVGEFMPIKIFINNAGSLKDESSAYLSFPSSGWWNCIVAEDMDGDGDIDLVVGNAGENNIFQVSEEQPMTLYYADFDGNGSIDPILCYFIDGTSYPMASRDDLTDQLPSLRKKFLQYETYARATITDFFDASVIKKADSLTATCMSTLYLENTGKRFEKRKLGFEGQLSPCYAIVAADINDDGNKDLLLTGNNTWTRTKFGRYRANHGTVLMGDGRGNFSSIPSSQTGLTLRGNIRSATTITRKGGTCLVAGENDGAVHTYRLNKRN